MYSILGSYSAVLYNQFLLNTLDQDVNREFSHKEFTKLSLKEENDLGVKHSLNQALLVSYVSQVRLFSYGTLVVYLKRRTTRI